MSESAKDMLVAVSLLAVGAIALLVITTTRGQPDPVGAATLTFATLPSAYAIILMGLSALLALSAMKTLFASRARSDQAADEASDVPAHVIKLRTGAALVLLIGYALLLEHVHFFVLTSLFLGLMFVVFGQRSPLKVAAVALGGSSAFYALFILVLMLPI